MCALWETEGVTRLGLRGNTNVIDMYDCFSFSLFSFFSLFFISFQFI